MPKLYEPLYSLNLGLCGFRCLCKNEDGGACTRVVRTQRGAEMHCLRKHGLKAQMEMTYGEESKAASEPVRRTVTAEHGKAGDFRGEVGELYGFEYDEERGFEPSK